MKSISSASIGSGAQSALTSAAASAYQWSRPSTISTSRPSRFTTITLSTEVQFFKASSTVVFTGNALAPRYIPSEVNTHTHWLSLMRSASALEENPANTTECTAPILAHANTPIVSSGTIGIYTATRSPFFTPLALRTFAKRHTSACNSEKVMRTSCSFGSFGSQIKAISSPLSSR